jgi:hypothetical protein
MDQDFADTLMEMQFFLGSEKCCIECPLALCIYRCESCFGGLQMSKRCLLNTHKYLLLHCVKVSRSIWVMQTLIVYRSQMVSSCSQFHLQDLGLRCISTIKAVAVLAILDQISPSHASRLWTYPESTKWISFTACASPLVRVTLGGSSYFDMAFIHLQLVKT